MAVAYLRESQLSRKVFHTMSAPTATPATRTINLPTGVPITFTEYGDKTEGRAVLMLHGGAGPRTMAGFSAAVSQHVHVITPTHPGFDGTPRPEGLDTIAELAEAYLDLLDELDLTGVLVLGNSIGGWIAAEMALRDNHGRIATVALVNAVGINAHLTKNQVVDTRVLAPAELSELAFVNPALRPNFASYTPEQRAAAAANQRALAGYAGKHFTHDPKLRGRLRRVTVPVLVIWGEQDGVAPLAYGRGYAEEFPNSHFAPIANAGHFPQLEQLEATLGALSAWADTVEAAQSADPAETGVVA
jgi:pimeloyl-ACP methyl ester carboxylesterase